MMTHNEPISRLFFRHGFLFILIMAVGLALTVLAVLYAPRKYQSQAKLLIQLGREEIGLDPALSSTVDTISLHRSRENEIHSQVQAMQNRWLMEKLVDDLSPAVILRGSLEEGEPSKGFRKSLEGWMAKIDETLNQIDPIDDREKAISKLYKNLAIVAERDSSLIEVVCLTKTPKLAQTIADKWIKLYREEQIRVNSSGGSLDFLKQEEDALLKKLQAARSTLEGKKSEYGVVTIASSQRILESQLELAKTEQISLQAKLAGAIAKLESLQAKSADIPERIQTRQSTDNTSDSKQAMRDRLFQLEIEYKGLLRRYDEEHPLVEQKAEQLAEAQKIYDAHQDKSQQKTEGINELYVSIQQYITDAFSNVESLRKQLQSTEGCLKELMSQSTLLNKQEAELAALERNVGVLEDQYRKHFVKREQARLAAELEKSTVSNVKVVQEPTFEPKPVSPKLMVITLLGVFTSFFSAVALSSWRETRYRKKTEARLISERSEPVRAVTRRDLRTDTLAENAAEELLSTSLSKK